MSSLWRGGCAAEPEGPDVEAKRPLSVGGAAQEVTLHRVDLGEVCRDVVVAAALAGRQLEAAAREGPSRTRAAEMDDGGELLLLLEARHRAGRSRENRRDVAVQEHCRELD